MRRFLNAATLFAAASALSLSGCGGTASQADEDLSESAGAVQGVPVAGEPGSTGATRSYAVAGFSGVVLAGADNVVVRHGDAFRVTATGDAAALDRLVIRVREGRLEVRRKAGIGIHRDGGITVNVTMPALSSLIVVGTGSVDVDSLTGERAEVILAGTGNARIADVDALSLEASIPGAGTLKATGQTESISISIAGSGDVESPNLAARHADISIVGAGGVEMAVTGDATISIVGSGDVDLTGGARCETSRVGPGNVRCR